MKKLFFPLSLLFILIMTFVGLFYYLFDHYVESVGVETVTAWAKNEENSIIEGNLLSSVTKAQKLLLSSEVVKGVAIFDLTDIHQGPLLEFGERIQFLRSDYAENKIQTIGFLKKLYLIKSPSDQNLRIIFSIYSGKISSLFWITSAVFAALTIIFLMAILAIRREQQNKIEKFAQKAKQAAHDLAQPIVLLNSLIQNIDTQQQETIRSSVGRINSIVDDLMDKKMSLKRESKVEKTYETTIFKKIETLIEEIKITTNNMVDIKFESNSKDFELQVDHHYMIRIFSNLIQNSIEANANKIILKVQDENDSIVFNLSDNGQGIPESVLSRVGEEYFTFGKQYGTGLGLFAAKKFVSENNGQLFIESKENLGTTIKISFLSNYGNKIILTEDTKVLILDDETSMHHIWKEKLNSLNFTSPVEYFTNPSDFVHRLNQLVRDEIFLFSDFNLKDERTGLDIIESLSLADQSALVTGQDVDPEIRTRAKNIGTKLIGKSSLSQLQIVVV
ncbi:MAG: hypothetical protein JNL11_10915 [Bdellovibrionaceae bacterium]|nr:hypothetical protein [Pseudobdellovibrionaceae bacterium]